MNFPALLTAGTMLLSPVGAIAADEAVRTEQPQAKDAEQSAQLDRYTALIKQMQQRLKAEGFDPGPIDGESGGRTQAALAQFQLSRSLPAGGQLDDKTLAELGVERDTQASAGATAESSPRARPDSPADRPEPQTGQKPES